MSEQHSDPAKWPCVRRGKEAFDSPCLARKELKRLRATLNRRGLTAQARELNVYRYRECGFLHVGKRRPVPDRLNARTEAFLEGSDLR
jgi:hypothetical protein